MSISEQHLGKEVFPYISTYGYIRVHGVHGVYGVHLQDGPGGEEGGCEEGVPGAEEGHAEPAREAVRLPGHCGLLKE